jgi:hypothetical protein
MSLEADLSGHLDQKQDLPAGFDAEQAFNDTASITRGGDISVWRGRMLLTTADVRV